MSADHYDEFGDPIYDPGIPEPPAEEPTNVVPISGKHETPAAEHDDWAPIDLHDPQWDEPAQPPDLHEFLYTGQRHLISGPPEATKTLIAYEAAIRLAQQHKRVVIIDFEMGARRAKLLLLELGASSQDLTHIRLITPETPPKDALEAVIAWQPALVIIDAGLGAYLASGLDDNNRTDVERFAAVWVNPLWRAGIATLVIDHVSKNVDTRFGAIGSERKGGFVEVHIGLSVGEKKSLTRGGKATIETTVHKDRGAYLRRPHPYFIDISSDPDTHHLTVHFRSPEHMPTTEKGGMRPTIKMEQVSRWVAKQPSMPSKNATVDAVGGNKPVAAAAIEVLLLEGYLAEHPGPRQAKLLEHLIDYRQDQDQAPTTPLPPTSPDFPPTSPGGKSAAVGDRLPPTSPVPLKGAGSQGGSRATPLGDENTATSPNADEDEIQRLLEKYESDLKE